MNIRALVAGLAASLIATLAFAEGPSHMRGTVANLSGAILTVTTRDGPTQTFTLADKVAVAAVKKIDLSAVAPGAFIGTAAQPTADGGLQAMEVVVFPEAMRGAGEGHYDWDLGAGTSMTNANVDAAVESKSGRELTLSYKGGNVKVTVPPDVPVVTFVDAGTADLKPGTPVFVVSVPAADGTRSAVFVAVGKDGVAPPM
jgi:hypothetical protein